MPNTTPTPTPREEFRSALSRLAVASRRGYSPEAQDAARRNFVAARMLRDIYDALQDEHAPTEEHRAAAIRLLSGEDA